MGPFPEHLKCACPAITDGLSSFFTVIATKIRSVVPVPKPRKDTLCSQNYKRNTLAATLGTQFFFSTNRIVIYRAKSLTTLCTTLMKMAVHKLC